jgi:two-component system, chemotaxis family, protein-glutamate methylesterase/glutaminase
VSKIRVLIADDSLTARGRLARAIEGDPECEVVGEAEDGRRAFDLCAALRPSVVTLDMLMPDVDGLAATEQIMAFCPTPILIVSASPGRERARKTWKALGAGAVDFIEKPRPDEDDGAFDRRFLAAVKLVSRIKVITHLRARIEAPPRSMPARVSPPQGAVLGARRPTHAADVKIGHPQARHRLVAIGASTGGPSAVATVLGALPLSFPLPILLVLHIGAAFGASFVRWMATQLRLPVAFAVHGEPLPQLGSARVIVAPPDRHLILRQGRLHLTTTPERHSCRPSVDELFTSVAEELGPAAIGCLLTGMGRDGAAGMLAMKSAGAVTLAQDEATSVVFGMPREAIRLSAVDQVLPLPEIAGALLDLARIGEKS